MSSYPESSDRLDGPVWEATTRVLERLDRTGRAEAESPEHPEHEALPRVSATLKALVRRLVGARNSEDAVSDSIDNVMAAVVRSVDLARALDPIASDRADISTEAIDAFSFPEAGHAVAPISTPAPWPEADTGGPADVDELEGDP